jgi:hypothetical protein
MTTNTTINNKMWYFFVVLFSRFSCFFSSFLKSNTKNEALINLFKSQIYFISYINLSNKKVRSYTHTNINSLFHSLFSLIKKSYNENRLLDIEIESEWMSDIFFIYIYISIVGNLFSCVCVLTFSLLHTLSRY